VRDAGPILAFFVIGVIIVTVVLLVAAAQQQHRKQILERVAQRFRGRAENLSLFTLPQVRLRFHSYPAVLKYTKVGKNSHHTHFTITWTGPALRCEVYPQDIMSGFRRLWGMEDIEIGSPQFDRMFFISGNDKAQIRELLSAEVQTLIMRLCNIGGANFFQSQSIQVKWGGGVMTVTKPSYLGSYEELEAFIQMSSELFVAALNTRTSGITFVERSAGEIAEPDAADSQCPVCGEALAANLVYCNACRTPHHRECWEYFGGCSTYACGNKQFVTRGKRPTSPKPQHR